VDELTLLQVFNNGLRDFHWQRPLWLLGIPAAVFAAWYLLRGQAQNNNWKQVISAELLPHLLQGSLTKPQKWPLALLAVALILASLSMAGPSWEKLPQPIHKTESALIVLLDLSPSMMAEDVKPSRLVRARLKLMDLLKQRQEGLSALIAYAGEAYTVTPLTDDTDTIISLIPSLSPGVMPLGGSNTEMAVTQALTLFKDAGLLQGEILLVTDGVTEEAIDDIDNQLSSNFRLSILGVGSKDGAPIPIRNGGFAKDRSGSIVLAKLNRGELDDLAQRHGGRYRTLTSSDRDISALASQPELLSEQTRQLEREFDTWIDRGAWLCLLLIPFAILSFRRGWLLALPLMLMEPQHSYALGWDDLWKTKDQQGEALLQNNQAQQAAETFQRQDWKAAAQYRAGDYKAAAEGFAADDSAQGHFNRGNALAKAGDLPAAIEAYQHALQQDPGFEDASANRQVVEELLEQQEQQQQDQNQNQDGNSDQQQDQQSGDSQSNSDQQNNQDSDSQQDSQQDSQSNEPFDSDSSQEPNSPSDSEEQIDKDSEKSDLDTPADDEQSQQADNPSPQESGEEAQESATEQAAQGMQESDLSEEEQQAMEQWLRKIPDDPSGLMRKKFEHQYRQRRKEYQQGSWQPPANDANNRW